MSVICGAETWKQMVEFTNSKKYFLKECLKLPNAISLEDIIFRLFSLIESYEFENCFILNCYQDDDLENELF